jgi:hypothetical protein
MNRDFPQALVLAAALALFPALAQAAPVISSITPDSTSSNTGATIDIYGTGFGASDDRIYFPGNNGYTIYTNPVNWGSGWVRVVVPKTWSGNVQIANHGIGDLSNSFNHNISFARYGQWASGSMTWWLNQNGSPGCTVEETRAHCQGGYDAWTCASGLSANYQGTTATLGNSRTDGINVLCWVNSGWGDPSVIAVTSSYYYVSTGNLIEFDINFNSQHYTWSCTGAAGSMDVQNIAAHEEGHSIGLLDLYGTNDVPKTMYGFSGNGETYHATLTQADAEGAEYLYSHSGRANLTWGTPSGWYGPIVPRNTNDANGSFAPLPATLNGNATVYFNEAEANTGLDCAAPGSTAFDYLDGASMGGFFWGGVLGPGSADAMSTNFPVPIRGGRHTWRIDYDTRNEIVESNESDNSIEAQFVFDPYTLTDQAPVTRNVPPAMGSGAARNCDGFEFTGNWWGCVAVIPMAAGDDYDLQLFDDYASSTAGFATPLRTSAWGGTASDFVLVNGNNAGYGVTRWAGVDRWAASSGANCVIHQSNSLGTWVPDTVYNDSVTVSTTITGNQIVKVYEIYLGSPTRIYNFRLTNLSGTADLNISLYDAAGDYFSKSQYVASSQAVGAGTNESFNFHPPRPGYYGLVVWKRDMNDLGLTNTYRLAVGVALSNLNATVTPAGFSSPIVPRNTTGATYGNATVTPTLDGNTNDTYLNWGIQQEGPNNAPGWGNRIYLDTDSYVAWGACPDYNWPTSWQALNIGTLDVPGGRHSLTNYADYDGTLPETNETDNIWTGQWVWSPEVVAKATPLFRGVPPDRGSLGYPNAHGYQAGHNSGYAWVVSEAPTAYLDDYDLYCYTDYSGSTSGFSVLASGSGYGLNATDFVVGHYSGTPNPVYPAVVRYAASGGGNPYAIDQTDSDGRVASLSGTPEWVFPVASLGQNRLADVYEMNFLVGLTYHILLTRLSGSADLMFGVYPATSGGVNARSGALGSSMTFGPDRDSLAFTPTASGWHPIVVFRANGGDLGALTYRLRINRNYAVDVADETRHELALAPIAPNPVVGRARVEFTLASAGRAQLAVFDIGGRQVRLLADGGLGPGRHEVLWDARDDNGAALEAGLYWVRLETAGRTLVRRVSVLK